MNNMKYLVMMNTMKSSRTVFTGWSREDTKAHIGFMMRLNKDLRASGELVSAEGLSFPDEAKLVRADKDGSANHGRRVSGKQRVPCGILDPRRREPGTCLCDCREDIGGAGRQWRTPQYADRSTSDYERAAP